MAAAWRGYHHGDPLATLLEHVPRNTRAAGDIVGTDKVAFERSVLAAQIAFDEHNRKACRSARREDSLIEPHFGIADSRREQDQTGHSVVHQPAGLPRQLAVRRFRVEHESGFELDTCSLR